MTDEEVSARIEAVLYEALAADPSTEPGDMIGSWVVVAHIDSPNRSRDTQYYSWHAGGDQPYHVALGLLSVAIEQLDESDE